MDQFRHIDRPDVRSDQFSVFSFAPMRHTFMLSRVGKRYRAGIHGGDPKDAMSGSERVNCHRALGETKGSWVFDRIHTIVSPATLDFSI